MFSQRWRPFRLFGIPVSVDLSWLIILALITWTMSEVIRQLPSPLNQWYPDGLGLTTTGYWLTGLVAALAFFGCIVLHEMGHALVARAYGMPVRGITLFLFGGVSELEGEPPSAAAEFFVAVAGPFVSLLLTLAFGVLAGVGYNAGWQPVVVVVLAYLASINLTVLVFNLIPAFPLDGGRVLRSILWGVTGRLRQSTWWASLFGQVFAWVLMFFGIMQFFAGNFLGGLWMGLIGMFLNSAARGSYEQVLIKQLLEGEPIRRLMTDRPLVVPPEMDLHHLVEDYVFRYHRKAFPVGHGDHLEGFISTEMLADIPREEWDRHSIGEVMRRDLRGLTISPNTDALEALRRFQNSGAGRLLVVDNERLIGIVSMKDVLRFLQLKMELHNGDLDDSEVTPPATPSRINRVQEETVSQP